MEALARVAARRPVAVLVLATAIVLLGWTAWRKLPLDLLPDLHSPTVVVSVRSGDRPPAEMERIYGEQIEQRLFAVRGIRDIAQVARTGRIVATVGFGWDADMDFALVEVEKAVGPIRSDPEVDEVLVRRFDPRQAPVLTLGLVARDGGPDLVELRRVARRQLAVALERLDGVAEVRVTGGREEELRVELDPYRMEAHGITLSEVEGRLRAANVDINAGTLEEGSRVFLVRGLSRFRGAADVSAVVVRFRVDPSGGRVPVRVSDLARVVPAHREITHLVRVDGLEGVGLAVYKEAGANTVAVSRTVRSALGGLAADLPAVDVRVIADEAALVENAVADVEEAALVGIALAVAVLLVFLRAIGPTLIVSAAVPVSLLATLLCMHFSGQSLNVMTLAGLALGAGMLVDNAIVVIEAVFRRLQAGEPPEEAAARGTGEVAGAIVASTATACAVFLPVIFMRGLAARLVSGLSFSVVVALVASLFAAVLLIPALSTWLLPRHGARALDPGSGAVERGVLRLLERPWLVVAATAIVTAASLWALSRLGTELLPPADPQQLALRVVAPPGTRVEATARVTEALEQIVREAAGDDLQAVLSEIGRIPEDDRWIREEQTEENTARVLVRLAETGRSARQIAQAAAPAVAGLEGLEVAWEVGASALARALGSTGPPIVVELAGQSLDDLRLGAAALARSLGARSELWNVQSSFEGGPPELRVHLDRTLADGLGIDLDLVTASLEASLDGRTATVMTTGDEERDVTLRLPEVRRDQLLAIPLRTATGIRATIGDVARIEPEAGAREIFRRDQRRVARVTARIAPAADFPAARAAALEGIAAADLPAGLAARLAGEEEERERTFEELRWAALLALLLVFMVLAATFESLVHPLTVVSAVPVSLVGVAVLLVPLGRPIGVMEMLGLIVLAGVAVNDAILLVDAARQFMRQGLACRAALARAAAVRLRPILMNTAANVLALVPLALGSGEAARLRAPLALTIIGGLVASIAASLVSVPALYLLLERVRRRPGR